MIENKFKIYRNASGVLGVDASGDEEGAFQAQLNDLAYYYGHTFEKRGDIGVTLFEWLEHIETFKSRVYGVSDAVGEVHPTYCHVVSCEVGNR